MSRGGSDGGSTGSNLSQAELAERLRPRGVAEVLDGAFGLYREGFAQITLAQMVYALPVIALCLVAPIGAGIWALLVAPAQRAMSYYVGMDRLLARKRPLGKLLVGGLVAWPGMVLLLVLQVIVTAVLASVAIVPFGVPGVMLSASGSEALGVTLVVVGVVISVALVLVLTAFVYVWEAVFLFERDWNALVRSARLVRGGFWKVALTALVAYFIVLAPTAVLQAAIIVDSGGFRDSLVVATPKAWHGIASALVAVLLTPFAAYVSTLLWVDRRAVREGLDLSPSSPGAAQER